MTTETTLQNIQDAITALKDGWASTALNILEEARLDEMAKQKLIQAGIYPPGTQESVALRDALAEALTSVYVCGRVWEAWQYGTMSEGDFHPAAECNEVLDSLVEAVTKATPPAAQRQWTGLTDEEIEAAHKTASKAINYCTPSHVDIARAVEAKLKEKNT